MVLDFYEWLETLPKEEKDWYHKSEDVALVLPFFHSDDIDEELELNRKHRDAVKYISDIHDKYRRYKRDKIYKKKKDDNCESKNIKNY